MVCCPHGEAVDPLAKEGLPQILTSTTGAKNKEKRPNPGESGRKAFEASLGCQGIGKGHRLAAGESTRSAASPHLGAGFLAYLMADFPIALCRRIGEFIAVIVVGIGEVQ